MCLLAGCGGDKSAAHKAPYLAPNAAGKMVMHDSKGVPSMVGFTLNDWAAHTAPDAPMVNGAVYWKYEPFQAAFGGPGEIIESSVGDVAFYRNAIVYVDPAGEGKTLSLWFKLSQTEIIDGREGIFTMKLRGIEVVAPNTAPPIGGEKLRSIEMDKIIPRL